MLKQALYDIYDGGGGVGTCQFTKLRRALNQCFVDAETPPIVQLLLLYVQWGPRNYEKCKMFRLIHIIMMSLNKFRFVAQVATLGNFFY